jgi:hypothetical protein
MFSNLKYESRTSNILKVSNVPEYSHSLMTFDHSCYNLPHSLQPLLLELINHSTATLLQPPGTPAITYKNSTTHSLPTFSHSCYHLPTRPQPALQQPSATPTITYRTQHNLLSDNLQPLLLSLTKHSTAH